VEPQSEDSSGFDVQWAIPLDEPMSVPRRDADVEPSSEPNLGSGVMSTVADGFLLRGGDLPSDGIYRPRLGRHEDAA